ncbi:MAG: GerMN domain-containing protein [bacterium]|nr:GerMN domain-containing protein [bacterium]
MLRRKALRKILITTFTIFTLFVIYLIPEKMNTQYLDPKIEVEYVVSLGTNEIYLLGPNNYLVKTNVLLEGSTSESKIRGIIEYLTINKSEKLPVGLNGIIPANTKVNEIKIENNIAAIDFSKELLSGSAELEERLIESIVYSTTNLPDINGITILIEGIRVTELPNSKKQLPEILNREFGINKVYDIDHRNNIKKVTLYYMNDINNNLYYVPVTKYINDDREKINIIIDNLSSNYLYETNLMSLLKEDTELINYQIEDELMLLNFNHNIFTSEKLLEEVSYTIAYSIFDNYPVNTVLLEVAGKQINKIEKER